MFKIALTQGRFIFLFIINFFFYRDELAKSVIDMIKDDREKMEQEKEKEAALLADSEIRTLSKSARRKKGLWGRQKTTIARFLTRLLGLGPLLVAHCLQETMLSADSLLESLLADDPESLTLIPEQLDALVACLEQCLHVFKRLDTDKLKVLYIIIFIIYFFLFD